MPIHKTINGVKIDDKKAELEDLLQSFHEDPSAEKEAQLLKLYEETSGFKQGCNVCQAGRNLFVNSLKDFKNGDNREALAKLRGSFKTVSFKWGRLRNKLNL